MLPEERLMQERISKLNEVRKENINPYPYKFVKSHQAEQVQTEFAKLKKQEESKKKVKVAGRMLTLRKMGKVSFATILDASGKVQLFFSEALVGKKQYAFLKKFDMGDFIGAEGVVFRTKMGELSVKVKKYEMLTKSIRPLPEKFHGLKDTEIRYRKRYLDLITNPDVKDVFVKRAQVFNAFREVLNKKGYLEVDTPVLQSIYGGANAKPFISHLNALDMKVYMRIANELYLKRLIVGGFEKVFEFARDFRNEGVDRTHNPEFTQIEFYEAYTDLEGVMKITEELISAAAKKIHGTKTKVKWRGNTIDFKTPFKKMTMVDAIKKYAKIDVTKLNDKELFDLRTTYNIDVEGDITRGLMIALIFEELVEDKLIQPTFITEHPVETTPLAKPSRKTDGFVERFELFIGGMEISNAYSEMNDPILQRKLLEEQAEQLRAGAEEAHPMDEDFVQSIEYGMPPTGGCGIGMERVVMLLTGQESIRDVLLFPFMKPEK